MTGTRPTGPAVRVLRLSLAGFGIYERPSRYLFPKGASVLEGPNEYGKSTLLHGLAAAWFGLPAESNPSRFGSGRFRSFSHPNEFWGEVEWERAGRVYTLHRSFETHRVRLTETTGSGIRILFEGEHNPRATSSAGSAFRSVLQEHLGITDLDLFLETFCLSQPLPDETSLGAELQHLLSGSRSGRVDDVLQKLFQRVKDLTKGTGDLNLVRPGATRAQNQREPGRLETLAGELDHTRRELTRGQEVLDRLNSRNEELEKVQGEIRQAREDLEQAERRRNILDQWLKLNQERRNRQASLQQTQKGLEQLSAVDQELEALQPELTGPYAPYSDAGPGLAEALEELEEAEANRIRAERTRAETEGQARRLDEEAEAHSERLKSEYAAVRGRPDLLARHRQAAEAAARRRAREEAMENLRARAQELEEELRSFQEWEGVRPDLLRPEVEAILNDVRTLSSNRKRMEEIDRQSEERRFLAGERLETLKRKIADEERHRLLTSRLKELETGQGFEGEHLAAVERERQAKQAELRNLEEKLESDFPGLRGRRELPSVARRLAQARERGAHRREEILSLEREAEGLKVRLSTLDAWADLDPAALRREVEEIFQDVRRAGEIEARLAEIARQTEAREFLSGERLEQVRETISLRERLRETSLRIRELELAQIRARHEAAAQAGRRAGEPLSWARGPISLWLCLVVGLALGAGLHFGLGFGLPESIGAGLGAVVLLQIVSAALRGRSRHGGKAGTRNRSAGPAGSAPSGPEGSGAASPVVSKAVPEAAEEGDPAAALERSKAEQAELERRAARASQDLGPYAETTGQELARMEERWELLETEAARLRRERAAMLRRRFGLEGEEDWRNAPAVNLPPSTAPLLQVPGAPTKGSLGALVDWLSGLDPQTWQKLDQEAALREESRLRASQIERDLARLRREENEDQEAAALREELKPLSEDLPVEEIEQRVQACSTLEQRIAALESRLEELPDEEEVAARRRAAEERLASLWDVVREAWPEAPERPDLEGLRRELKRLEAGAQEASEELGPYGRATRAELEKLQEKWRLFDQETGRLREKEAEIAGRRFGRTEWESTPADGLPQPFDEILLLPGAPREGTAGEVIEWLRSLDPDSWAAFQRRAAGRRERERDKDRLERDLERLAREHEDDRDFERLIEALAPFTLETPEDEIRALLEGCRECEQALHTAQERRKGLPGAGELERIGAEAERRLEEAWCAVNQAWPGARERAAGQPLETWARLTREEERAARRCWQKAREMEGRRETILRTAGAQSREELESRREESQAVLGQVVLRIQGLEDADPLLAASRDQADPLERGRILQRESEQMESSLQSHRRRLREAEERERGLLRELARLEGSPAPNVAQLEIRIRQMETEQARLRRERDALALAYDWVRQAADTFQQAYREELEERVTGHFRALTATADRRVDLGDDFACRVVDADGRTLAAEQLSQGARDQLALSIRLAVADLLTDTVPLPLFFDDPFVHYDSGRLENLRETLETMGQARQWVLLTHRSDLGQWAEPVRVERN